MTLVEEAKRLIVQFEGLDQPYKWPGGDSGITIGRGYDLGYCSLDEFISDWQICLRRDHLDKLNMAIGIKGENAKAIAYQFIDIQIDVSCADMVFDLVLIRKYIPQTFLAFPGISMLPVKAQAALVSLIYNRGSSMTGVRRMEMRAIRESVAINDLHDIAYQLRKMKRLWIGKGLNGLLKRRDAEAALVESCIRG